MYYKIDIEKMCGKGKREPLWSCVAGGDWDLQRTIRNLDMTLPEDLKYEYKVYRKETVYTALTREEYLEAMKPGALFNDNEVE